MMIRKLVACACAAAMMVTGAIAQDAEIPLDFEAFPITDAAAASYWPEALRQVPANSDVVPEIFIAEVPTSDGSSLIATMFWSAGVCGSSYCQAKIIENGAVIAQFPVCNVPTGHFLSVDGLTYKACDETIVLADNPPPTN